MENIAPIFYFVDYLKIRILKGDSVNKCIREFTIENTDEFSQELGLWYMKYNVDPESINVSNYFRKLKHREYLIFVLESGLRGRAIYDKLDELSKYLGEKSIEEVEDFLTLLKTKLLLPFALCFFPSFLLLLWAPIYDFLKKSL